MDLRWPDDAPPPDPLPVPDRPVSAVPERPWGSRQSNRLTALVGVVTGLLLMLAGGSLPDPGGPVRALLHALGLG